MVKKSLQRHEKIKIKIHKVKQMTERRDKEIRRKFENKRMKNQVYERMARTREMQRNKNKG